MDFRLHYTGDDLERLFDSGFRLPDDFLFGVANSAFQVEGGFNGRGEPLNNWADFERKGKVETSGDAARFWTDYPEQIDLARSMNLNAFRMSIEWARVQPSTTAAGTGSPPAFDRDAIEAYAGMIAAIEAAGMEPVVTLHHFTHPNWLGLDFWLDRGKLDMFTRYVEEVASQVNTILVEKRGAKPVRYWVTINEPNVLCLLLYALRYFPHGRSGAAESVRAWNNMIDAHCRAYDTLHRVYEEKGWEPPLVACNTVNWCHYHMDKFATDLLLARRNDVPKAGLREYIQESKIGWDREISAVPDVRKTPAVKMLVEKTIGKWAERHFNLDSFNGAVEAIYSSPLSEKLDFLALDYYDPWFRNYPKIPSLRDIRERRLMPISELWEQVLNPVGLYHFLKGYAVNGTGLPLLVLESGMCHRVSNGRVEQRHDGATRDRFLQSYIYEVMRAVKDGIPVGGYFCWTLVDNYEWGSYEPRFGIHTVDRSRTPVRVSSVDAWGVNAARTYGELAGALLGGDRRKATEAFSRYDL
ncbi:MAG TPA: family 1 glycosylhydrolase [Candidatus Anoxymicrobiaceae bacterium]